MMELVAIGPEPGQRWRRPIPADRVLRLGRSPDHGWSVPWDLRISREHAELRLDEGQLHVQCLEGALNPAYLDGNEIREFSLPVGETFRIGSTTFRFERSAATSAVTQPTFAHFEFDRAQIEGFRFQNAEHCLEALANFPKIINCRDDDEYAQYLVRLLLDGIPQATTAAVVVFDPRQSSVAADPQVLRLVSRDIDSHSPKPSRTLVNAAMQRTETVLHIWSGAEPNDEDSEQCDVDWAFCSPLPKAVFPHGSLYLSGRLNSSTSTVHDLHGDIRFVQLLSDLTAAIRTQAQPAPLETAADKVTKETPLKENNPPATPEPPSELGGFFSPAA